jgi:diguanylate cyclase (GGDEF)-like protein
MAAGLLTAAGASLILAAVLRVLHRLYRRGYLAKWAWSWTALFLYFVLAAASQLLRESRPAASLAAAALALVAGLCQAVWLLLGTQEITQGEAALTTKDRRLLFGLVGIGVALIALAVSSGNSGPSQQFILNSFRALLVGAVFVISAVALWRFSAWNHGVGRRLVSMAFLVYGLHQLQYFGLVLFSLIRHTHTFYSIFIGFAEVVLQFIAGLGVVIWFLEEEREGVVMASRQIEHLAYHDPLTGLPNRKLFLDRLRQELSAAPRRGTKLAVMFLDLDRFKVINDSLGHSHGDELLYHVAQRLTEAVRRVDTVARLGGDEFTLLLLDLTRTEDARQVGEKVLQSLRRPFQLHGHEIYVSTSIGLSIYPQDGVEAEILLKNADIAMYQAKDKGRDNLQLYSPTMSAVALERLDLESDLRRALANNEFELYFQPILDLEKNRFDGVEALIRWRHPARGQLLPSQFLSLSEMIGMSYELDLWVLENACQTVQGLHRDGWSSLRVAVNLSARAFHHPDLVRQVEGICSRTKFPPPLLELEITENLAMQNVEATLNALRGLKELGVKISIDDFGIGYSSLSYLRTFPLDTVKIDQSFIRDLTVDAGDTAIARAIIAIAHSLGLMVVAEGVEDTEQLEILRQERCHRVQGFLFSRPIAAQPLAEFLAEKEKAPIALGEVRSKRDPEDGKALRRSAG